MRHKSGGRVAYVMDIAGIDSTYALPSLKVFYVALSDLEGKSVNIDTELTSTTIRDTSVLKKIAGRQPIRMQRKNERAYDRVLTSRH